MAAGILLILFGIILLVFVQIFFRIRQNKLKSKWDDDNEMS